VLADQLLAAHRGRNLSEIFGFAAQDVEPVQYPLLIERNGFRCEVPVEGDSRH
jgi:hypothetical protein